MPEPTAKVIHFSDVPDKVFGDEAPGVTIRWLIDEANDGAPYYAMRMITVAPGGNTPRHTHPYEHENFMVSGKGRLFIEGQWHDLEAGYVALVPPDVEHQYVNAEDEPFQFLCSIPVQSRIQG